MPYKLQSGLLLTERFNFLKHHKLKKEAVFMAASFLYVAIATRKSKIYLLLHKWLSHYF